MADTVMVTVRVLPGRSLTQPDGRLVGEGEEVTLPPAEAEFAVRMGAAEVAAEPAPKKVRAAAKAQE